MSEVETVEVYDVAAPRRAPVEYVGRLRLHSTGRLHLDVGSMVVSVQGGDVLVARPGLTPATPWRSGRAKVGSHAFAVEWHRITAICEGDYIYRIGKPLTPSLEERVAMLERRIYPDLVVADDAEKAGRPEVARELRAKVEWWRDPEIDWTGIER